MTNRVNTFWAAPCTKRLTLLFQHPKTLQLTSELVQKIHLKGTSRNQWKWPLMIVRRSHDSWHCQPLYHCCTMAVILCLFTSCALCRSSRSMCVYKETDSTVKMEERLMALVSACLLSCFGATLHYCWSLWWVTRQYTTDLDLATCCHATARRLSVLQWNKIRAAGGVESRCACFSGFHRDQHITPTDINPFFCNR